MTRQDCQQTADQPTLGISETMAPLDPRYRSVLRLEMAFSGVLTITVVLLADLMLLRQTVIPIEAAAAALALTLVLVLLLVPDRRYRSWSYALAADELHVRHGVWTHFYTIIPVRRIQHIDVAQDPAARLFGLASLVVHTAGTRSSSVAVPGLKLREAERLRDELRRFIGQDWS